LKIELQKGQMKAVKGFTKTCFSESLIADPLVVDGEEGDAAKEDHVSYQGGLGLKYKFPGDPKKYVRLLIFSS
jgi:hypothetical protein